MREAINILIDRDYIVENIGQTGQVIATSYIPLGMMDGNGGIFKDDPAQGYFDAYAINDDYDGTVEEAIERFSRLPVTSSAKTASSPMRPRSQSSI